MFACAHEFELKEVEAVTWGLLLEVGADAQEVEEVEEAERVEEEEAEGEPQHAVTFLVSNQNPFPFGVTTKFEQLGVTPIILVGWPTKWHGSCAAGFAACGCPCAVPVPSPIAAAEEEVVKGFEEDEGG